MDPNIYICIYIYIYIYIYIGVQGPGFLNQVPTIAQIPTLNRKDRSKVSTVFLCAGVHKGSIGG